MIIISRLFSFFCLMTYQPSWFYTATVFLQSYLLKSILRYFIHKRREKGVHAFPKRISPKVKIIAHLEFELTYYDFIVQLFNHNATETSLWVLCDVICLYTIFLTFENLPNEMGWAKKERKKKKKCGTSSLWYPMNAATCMWWLIKDKRVANTQKTVIPRL